MSLGAQTHASGAEIWQHMALGDWGSYFGPITAIMEHAGQSGYEQRARMALGQLLLAYASIPDGPYNGTRFGGRGGQSLSRTIGCMNISPRTRLGFYAAAMKDMGSRQGATSTELGMFLRKVLPVGFPIDFQRNVSGGLKTSRRKWHWELPSLTLSRQQFDTLTRSEHPWPDMLGDAQP